MYGDEIYDLFVRIKKAFDPQDLMNPGKKVAPQEETCTLFRNVRYGAGYRTFPQKPLLHFPPGGYESEIEKCHGCAICKGAHTTTMCPTYKATRREHASPRAKANLLRAIITGALDPEQSYGEPTIKAVTDYCIECGMCAVECPSNVNIPKLMLEAKSKYRAAHRATPADMILGRAEAISRLGRLAAPLANRLMNRSALRRLAEPITGIDRRRPMARFARRTFREMARADGGAAARASSEAAARAAGAAPQTRRDYAAPTGGPPPLAGAAPGTATTAPAPTVAYFYDLFANYNDPELALAVERVLVAHGVRVVLPEQRASGIPEMLYGYADKALETAEYNVNAALPHVKEGAVLVSAEPTATFAFKVHYPDYMNSPDCSLVANATRDLGEFLVQRRLDHPEAAPAAGPLRATRPAAQGTPLRIGYHQPCHLKAQQVGNRGLELLREIPGVEVIDLAAGCCGMAGTFGMKAGTYDFSMRTGRPLFDRVAEVAPDLLASECSTCRMQLAQATGIETIHPIRLLAEAYGA
jgi:Fe-S oxidoreductase